MTSNEILWGAAGAAVAVVLLRRHRQAQELAAAATDTAPLGIAVGDHVGDDGPESDSGCCAECGHSASTPCGRAAGSPPIIPALVPPSTIDAPAATAAARPARMPRGPVHIYMGGGVTRDPFAPAPHRRIIDQRLGGVIRP
jgi:hypothetical protein